MVRLYDTLSKSLKEVEDREVKMYVCGLTPYDDAHVGHGRNFVAFDLLKRFLLFNGLSVKHVQNITDVEDKIIRRAVELGVDPLALAEDKHEEALALFDELNILRADSYPRVSSYIEQIVSFIEKLVEKGHAYETETGVYFDVSTFPEYGKLSGQNIEEIRKHRIEPDPTKKNPEDFALWKKTKPGEEPVGWESPWGYGRPGWHIECSVMSISELGAPLTIHGGARDLIFPHHENEMAQSEAYLGSTFSKLWVHSGFITVKGQKMSKSLGNFTTLKDAIAKHGAQALRFFFLSSHFQSPVDYSDENLERASSSLEKILNAYRSLQVMEGGEDKLEELASLRAAFLAALENNLNTPEALKNIHEVVRVVNTHSLNKQSKELAELIFKEFSFIFGIDLPASSSSRRERQLVELLLEIRQELRKNKLFDLSDSIRDKLSSLGVEVLDSAEGSSFRFK